MTRKYDLRGNSLSCLIYQKHWSSTPRMRIILDVRTRNMQVSVFFQSVSNTEIKSEIEHILELLNEKHWKDIVSLQSVHNHPSECYELF